jgi:hypothetical protein
MKIKLLFSIALLIKFIALTQVAKGSNGYKIDITLSNTKAKKLYLCHYYGKGSTVFKDDSTNLDINGKGKLMSDKSIVGGIYMLLSSDKSFSTEFLLFNNDNIQIEMDILNPYYSAKFINSTINEQFYEYQRFLVKYGKEYQAIEASGNNSETLRQKRNELTTYRNNYIKANPTSFLSNLFNAVWEPEIHQNNAKEYYTFHYWDKYDFTDDRLIYTPIYERKLDDYLTKLVVPTYDSMKVSCEYILDKFNRKGEHFKYSLWFITKWAESDDTSNFKLDKKLLLKYMVDKYYNNGFAIWLDKIKLDEYKTKADKYVVRIFKADYSYIGTAKCDKYFEYFPNGDGQITYNNGGYLNGKFEMGKPKGNANCKIINDDKSWYEGEIIDGIENGQGTFRNTDGKRYTGNFTNGVPNGKFKIEEWTLMGLVSNKWEAEYNMGKLVSSNQTENSLDNFLSGKHSSSSSSNSNDEKETSQSNSNSELKIPNIKSIEFDKNTSDFVMGESERHYVKFEDGISGYVFYSPKYKEWFIDAGGANDHSYISKEFALNALYEYKKKGTVRNQGRKK